MDDSDYTPEGFIYHPHKCEGNNMKKYLKQSQKAPDQTLNEVLRDIHQRSEIGNYPDVSYGFNQYTSQFGSTEERSKMQNTSRFSLNIVNQINRDQKSLEGYNKNQQEWNKNIQLLEHARNKLNSKTFSQNYKANQEASKSGKDITLIDRLDLEFEDSKNKQMFPIALDYHGPDFNFKYSLRESNQRYQNNVPTSLVKRGDEFGSQWLRIQELKRARRNKKTVYNAEEEIKGHPFYIVDEPPKRFAHQNLSFQLPAGETLKNVNLNRLCLSPNILPKFCQVTSVPRYQKEIITKPLNFHPRNYNSLTKQSSDEQIIKTIKIDMVDTTNNDFGNFTKVKPPHSDLNFYNT